LRSGCHKNPVVVLRRARLPLASEVQDIFQRDWSIALFRFASAAGHA
jgi:hypothetical protein